VIVVLAFQGHALTFWARFLTFTENFFAFTVNRGVGPAWSLVVELMFYGLLPLLAWIVASLADGRRRRAAAILIALGAASLIVRALTVYVPEVPDLRWRLSLPATFMFFVPGMLLALVRAGWEERRPDWVRGPLASSSVWLLASVPLWLVVVYRYDLDLALAGAAFLVIGACVLPLEPGRLTRALQWKPLAVLGVASYSLYLWHVPVLEVVVDAGVHSGFAALALTAIPASIVVALLSYRWIEAPFLRLRRQWSPSSADQK
jgi:peptidoglycan/LPS O-acetylase OafA/YrhL